MKKSETFSPSAKAHAEIVVARGVAEKKSDKNDSDDDDSDKNNKSKSIQTHVLLFLSQLNWMGMHIVFAVALRSSTRAMVLSFYREMLACVLLTMYCFYVRQRRKKRKRKEMTTDEMTTEVVVTATAEQANDDATKKTKDENGVTSMQIVAVSIVLGAILALIRGSVVLANANAGPDVTSALVLTTPVLTFFFSALLRVEHFSFREVNREHPENVMKVLAILFVTISVAVVCSYKGALMFGDPK